MNKKLSLKQIWSISTNDEAFDPKLGIVYREIEKDKSYELILASTDLDMLSDSDLIITKKNSTLTYDITAYADIYMPVLTDSFFLKNFIGTIDEKSLEQIKTIRNENSKQTTLTFETGDPIVFKSDKRLSLKLKNLRIAQQIGNEAIEVVFNSVPDNIVTLEIIESKEKTNIFDALLSNTQRSEEVNLLARQLMFLNDKKVEIDEILYIETIDKQQHIKLSKESLIEAMVAA